ncbi:putative membrane protein [Spathaspora sp. JA1]|nr:putative membrane protein [Spathaspora sp. JA1]
MASYGLTNQVLTLYLKAINISEERIGIFMTLTLIGDTLISYFLTWNADRIGRRVVMIIGTIMMFGAGIVFAVSSHFWILLVAAIIGVISPSGDETGPFKSVEEASIAHLTPHNHRPEIFAFHGLFATAGAALGSLVCGVLVDYMNQNLGLEMEHCYRYIFMIYSGFSLIKLTLMLFLTNKCEVYVDNFIEEEQSDETSALLPDSESTSDDEEVSGVKSGLSNTTRYYLPRLLAIFMLDSLGYGFMPSAWVVYYLKITLALSASALGTLFFFTNSINAVSSLPSAYFSKLLGPVKAILFTQVPSAFFFAMVPIFHTYLPVAGLLMLYYTTTTMDVVPRQVLLTSIMPKHEITKVMGIVNIGKTFARCIGPVFTGKLAAHNKLYVGFYINGACVLLADIIMACNFLHLDSEILTKQSIENHID